MLFTILHRKNVFRHTDTLKSFVEAKKTYFQNEMYDLIGSRRIDEFMNLKKTTTDSNSTFLCVFNY